MCGRFTTTRTAPIPYTLALHYTTKVGLFANHAMERRLPPIGVRRSTTAAAPPARMPAAVPWCLLASPMLAPPSPNRQRRPRGPQGGLEVVTDGHLDVVVRAASESSSRAVFELGRGGG